MFKFTRNQLVAVYVLAGLALLGIVACAVKPDLTGKARNEITFTEPQETKEAPAVPQQPTELCVHVAGKVKSPGLYNLKPGCRVSDAIKAAGGALANADAGSINMAEVLTDGQQVYLAPKGEIPPPKKSVVRGGTSKAKLSATSKEGEKTAAIEKLAPGQGTVNINSAGLDELQRLPGIGPALGQRIVDYRSQHGRFNSVEQLDQVSGIGPKKLAKIKPLVTL